MMQPTKLDSDSRNNAKDLGLQGGSYLIVTCNIPLIPETINRIVEGHAL